MEKFSRTQIDFELGFWEMKQPEDTDVREGESDKRYREVADVIREVRDVLEDVSIISGDDLGLGGAGGEDHGAVAGGSGLGRAEADEVVLAGRSRGGGRFHGVEGTWRQGRG